MTENILELLDGKWTDGTRPKDLYELYISKNPAAYTETIVAGLHSEKRKVQSGCAELASLLSEYNPELLYPYIELFVNNLDAEAPVLRWEAVCTLGNLASIDKNKLTPAYIDQIASFLSDKSIVLQGHAVRALSKIAKASPDEAPRILDKLLNSTEHFPGNRVGFIIEAMEHFLPNEKLKPKIRKFVEPHAESTIKVVARKAKKILKKI
jgi:hypothetical protein